MVNENKRGDWILLIFSILIIGGALVWVTLSGTLQQTVTNNPQWTWHFIRATGSNAYVLLSASLIWGIFLNSQLVKNWSPGPVSIAVHGTISWLALGLTAVHMGLLLLDKYLAFQIQDLFVPFTGPYRPEAVGLGTLAMYIILLINLSFAFKKRLGQVWWKRMHYLSYLSFILVTTHAWFAGTDSAMPSMQLLLIGSNILVLLLLGVRVGRGGSKSNAAPATRSPRSAGIAEDSAPDPVLSSARSAPARTLSSASSAPAPAPVLDPDTRRAEARARAEARRAQSTSTPPPPAHPLSDAD
jgi:sulfoxide reductase heme-binding subunit YedZ